MKPAKRQRGAVEVSPEEEFLAQSGVKLFVTRQLPPLVMERLRKQFEVSVNPDDRVLEPREIIEGASKADGLLSLLTDTIDRNVIEKSLPLKVISNYAVGYNNIDVEAATEHGVPVCYTPGVLTNTTADLTLALILGVARRLVEGDKMVRAGQFSGWAPLLMLGADVHNKRLGIVGMGRIGQAVAKRALAFEMEVVYTSRQPKEVAGCRRVDLDELLETSDFVSLHAPITPKTRHLINEAAFKKMKRSAFLINTGRGPLVDERALVRALQSEEIAGAGLDVYEREPEIEEGLLSMGNCLLLPHLGSSTLETRTEMGLLAAENAEAIFDGRRPKAIVNEEVL